MEKETDFKGLFRLFTRSIIISMIGMIFPFLYILFPSMYVVESVKEGIIKVMATLIAVVFLIGAILGPIEAIIIFTSIMVLFFAFGINSEVLNSRETINAITSFYTNIAKDAGLSQGDLTAFSQSAEIYYKGFLQIFPSILIILSVVTSYITYTTAGRTLLSKGKFIMQPSSLEFLKFPREIILLSLATLAIFALAGDYFGTSGQIFTLNLMNLLYFMLFVAGISVLKFFMTRFAFKSFLQFLLIGLCLAISTLQIFVMILGALDQIINFRKIN